jgi:hypothetical protein
MDSNSKPFTMPISKRRSTKTLKVKTLRWSQSLALLMASFAISGLIGTRQLGAGSEEADEDPSSE